MVELTSHSSPQTPTPFVAQKQQELKNSTKMQKSVAREQKAVVVLQSWLRKTLSSDSKNVGIYKGNPMNKNILAIAIAAAVAAPSAFAAATVYGNAHMSVTASSSVANAGASTDQTNVTSNSSFLGVKGSEDLGAGMKAVYQMEFGVNLDGEQTTAVRNSADNGTANVNTPFNQRNSMVGLGGSFGTVMLGRWDSPIKMVGRKYDLFGDQVGNNRNVLGAAGNTHLVDGRHNNVIAYVSPTFSGVNATLAYVPGADATSAGNENFGNTANKIDAFSANVMYTAGAFDAGLGYINATNVLVNNTKAYNAYRLGAGYTFGAARINGIYQLADYTSGTDVKSRGAYGVGASYKVTAAGTVKGQYMLAENATGTQNGANMITVGYDHAMSKNTTVYALYAAANNNADATTTAMLSNGGTNDNTVALPGKDNSTFAVGVQHKF